MKPTNEQIKEFWEGCGLEYEATKLNGHPAWSIYGDDREWCETHYIEEMGKSINLNSLFKYAVPKVDNQIGLLHEWVDNIVIYGDPALALFWAIWNVISP